MHRCIHRALSKVFIEQYPFLTSHSKEPYRKTSCHRDISTRVISFGQGKLEDPSPFQKARGAAIKTMSSLEAPPRRFWRFDSFDLDVALTRDVSSFVVGKTTLTYSVQPAPARQVALPPMGCAFHFGRASAKTLEVLALSTFKPCQCISFEVLFLFPIVA